MRVRSDVAKGEIVVRHEGGIAAGTQVAVAVRPEKLALGNGLDNTLSGRVEELAFRGDATLCRVRLDSGLPVTLSLPNRERTGAGLPRSGETTKFSFTASDAVLLTQ
jgi:putrescine transport system ATP-binding protein